MRRSYVDEKVCATCKHFIMHDTVSRSDCDVIEYGRDGYPYKVTPSKFGCKKYEPAPYKCHCKCGTFMEPWFEYCPTCGKKWEG